MEGKNEFGKFLKDYMVKHEYKLEAFADKVGYSFGLISHYITGRRSPSYKFIREFFKKFTLTEEEKIEVLNILKKDKLPEEIQELENLTNPQYRSLDSRGKRQYKDLINEVTLMFNDEKISKVRKMKASEILINYRKVHGMTVAKFAELLGVSQVFLTHLEHDKRKISESLFERLEEFLSADEIKKLREAEQMKSVPEEVIKKIIKLENENKSLKEKYSQFDPRIEELDTRGLTQYEKAINEAAMFFNDEKIDEEDKLKLMVALNEVFFRSKEINKIKFAHKNTKDSKKNK